MAENIINDEDKLVAEIEVGSPITFNTSMGDLISPEEEEAPEFVDEVLEDTDQPEQIPEAEIPENESPEEPETLPQEDDVSEDEENLYEDYTEAALASAVLNRKRPGLFGDEVPKDLKWEDFIEKIDDYIDARESASHEHLLNSLGQAKEYVDFLLSGGDPRALETALQDVEYSKLDLNEATPEQKEAVIEAMYRDKGLTEDDAKEMVETLKLKNKLDEKAEFSVKHFDAKEKDILKAANEQKRIDRENQMRQQQQLTNNINQLIDKGEIMGLELGEAEKQDLKKAFFEPTEIREVPDGRGGTIMQKFTKYQVLEAEFKSSLEMQIAFGKLLLDGFDFSKVKEQGKRERDKDILDILDNRTSGNSRKKKNYNAYLTPVAEIDVK